MFRVYVKEIDSCSLMRFALSYSPVLHAYPMTLFVPRPRKKLREAPWEGELKGNASANPVFGHEENSK